MQDSGLNLFKKDLDVKRMPASINSARTPFCVAALKIRAAYDIGVYYAIETQS
jgi:hypothetical protein